MSLGLSPGSVHNQIRSVKGAPLHFCEDLIQIGARGAGPPDHEAVAFLEKFRRVERVPGTEYEAESSQRPLPAPGFLLGGDTGPRPWKPRTPSPAAS